METTRREIALFASDMLGVQTLVGQFDRRGSAALARADRRRLRDLIEETELPTLVLDPRAGLHIIDISDAYVATTGAVRTRICGHKLFDMFPDNPDLPEANGVSNLFESLQKAAQSGRTHSMGVQRYDTQDTDGQFTERYWRPMNTPVFDQEGRLRYLLNQVVEVSISRP